MDVYIADLDGLRLSDQEPHLLDEQSEQRLLCLATSASPVPYFRWFLNDQSIDGQNTAPLSIPWTRSEPYFSPAASTSPSSSAITSVYKSASFSLSSSSIPKPSDSNKQLTPNLARPTGSTGTGPSPWSGNVLLLRNISAAQANARLTCSASHPLYPSAMNASIHIAINRTFFPPTTLNAARLIIL